MTTKKFSTRSANNISVPIFDFQNFIFLIGFTKQFININFQSEDIEDMDYPEDDEDYPDDGEFDDDDLEELLEGKDEL